MSDELVARLLSHDDGLMTEAAVKIAALNGERAAINEMHDGLNGSLIKEKLENGRLRAENAKLRAAVTELTEENRLVGLQMDRMADEIEKLRAALKPFADAAERNLGPDDSRIVGDCTLGDLRAAAAAFKGDGG